ncbi:MAG TPA: ATP-binding cassette domain-containing protein [Anaeromyxobacteraceae bacterium]|nr:ATP-binding cassette domain-containing protein [Anaeromyxobacteraceae bacterium]
MNAYHLEGVRFSYGGAPVLDIPSLEVEAGRIGALWGPNGAGKSTLLHLMAFLEAPRAGRVRFFGEEARPERFRALRRRVGILLQIPYLFHATVAANLEAAFRARGVARGRRPALAAAALERLGLSGFEGRRAQKLSGGEAQRVALARLLVLEPDVLLLDEPTNHLDAVSAARIEETVLALNRERGVTVLVASHDRGLAHRLGARVWQVEDGRVGEAEIENVLHGSPVPGEPGVFACGGVRLVVQPLPASARSVRIGSREIVLSRGLLDSSLRNQLRGTIVRAEVLARGEVLVALDCGVSLQAVVTRASWEGLGLTVGATAVASVKATAVKAS